MKIRLFHFSLVASLLLGLAWTANAQAIKGSLVGTISDSSGAVAANASVTITETHAQ